MISTYSNVLMIYGIKEKWIILTVQLLMTAFVLQGHLCYEAIPTY